MKSVTSFCLKVLQGTATPKVGTAFFVRPGLVATACHVTCPENGNIWFHEQSGHGDHTQYLLVSEDQRLSFQATPLIADFVADIALLSCPEIAGVVIARLRSARGSLRKDWRGLGYLGLNGGKVTALRGTVDHLRGVDPHGALASRTALDLGLRTQMLLPSKGSDPLQGFSGTAVELDDGSNEVIGIVTSEDVSVGMSKLDAASADAVNVLCQVVARRRQIVAGLEKLGLREEECINLHAGIEPAHEEPIEKGSVGPVTLIERAMLRGYPALLVLCRNLKALRPDEPLADEILQLVQQHSRLDPAGPLRLGEHSVGLYSDRERSKSSIDTLVGAWGDSGSWNRPQPQDIVLDMALKGELPTLAAAIIRLAVHGGVRVLHVPEPEQWRQKVLHAGPGCLGNDNEFWRPEVLDPGSDVVGNGHWYLGPLEPRSTTEIRIPLALESVENVDNAMDRWVLRALNVKMIELVGSKESPPWFKWRIGHDLRRLVGPIWAGWHQLLVDPANPDFLRDFLRVMLRVSTGENGPTETPLAARIRIGPRTVNECLYAVAFALIIEAAVGKGTVPLSNPSYNFLHNKKKTHLVALKNVGQKAIEGGFDDDEYRMSLNAGYAFMPHCTRDFRLMNTRFSSSEESSFRFRDRDDFSVAVICRDEGIQKSMKDGKAALREYLNKTVYEGRNVSLRERLLSRLLSRPLETV